MILIVDDDKTIRLTAGALLRRAGYEVDTAADPTEALAKVRLRTYRIILMDMNFSRATSGAEGLELIQKVKIFQPETPVILMTAWASIELAVEGMRLGAYDFISKPWENRLLLQRVATAMSLSEPEAPDAGADTTSSPSFDRAGIIGRSRELTELLQTVERVAPTDAPVLILGENGTGKELIAQAIHANSHRRNGPFVMVNLGGVPQSLFESEMFGHAKGAFTGAVAARKGRFELADKGTIFLDEIGDLDASCQVKMLRVLQQHTFEPLGDSHPHKVDIRVVCATNADLHAMVADRTFREDLFYRINLITLRLPPLRERRDDIPLLARHFAEQAAADQHIATPEIAPEAMEMLCRLDYPGNIRQLRNIVERAVLIGGPRLLPSAFDTAGAMLPTPNTPAPTLDDSEARAIADALARCEGNLSRAARILGLTRQSLYRRMKKYGLK